MPSIEDNSEVYDIKALLSSSDRDYLVRDNGDQVRIEELTAKKVGLYFSASWCGPCRSFTLELVDAYNELSSNGEFEIIFISLDKDEESFTVYFSKMPWLAIPFSDSGTRRYLLDEVFKVSGIPYLVILDEGGNILSDEGDKIIEEYGAKGYPFTVERIKELMKEEEAAKRDQTLSSILVVGTRDGRKIFKSPVLDLEGKTVGLYFTLSSDTDCVEFTPKLLDVYEKLKEKRENFEVVTIPLDDDEKLYKQHFANISWFSLPVKDNSCRKLARYFELSNLPTLVIVGPDGKTLHLNAVEAIEEHGAKAYPFTAEKIAVLAEIEKAKEEAQTLESVLIHGDNDFVMGKDGAKIPKCALEAGKGNPNKVEKEEKPKEGWICEGEVCYKA